MRRHRDNVSRMDGSRKARGIIHVLVNLVFAIAIATLYFDVYNQQHQLH
jgi:hypothetical protein